MSTAAVASGPRQAAGRPLGGIRDWIVASDPAFSRLRLASRAMLALGLSAGLLAAISFVHLLPTAAYGMAVVIAFIGAMAVRDVTPWEQILTRFYAGWVAIAAIFVAGLLAPLTLAADLTFLVVIFAAVYLRKFGPRGFALGMIAFMAYFMGDYLRPQPTDIGWIAVAAAATLVVTHLVNNFLLPDHPERDFRRAMTTLDRRINLILRQLLDPSRGSAGAREGLATQLARLEDIVLMAEGFIPQGAGGALAATGPASDLAIALFDLQLAVERMVGLSAELDLPADLLAGVLHRDDAAIEASVAKAGDSAGGSLVLGVYRARSRIEAMLDRDSMPAFAPSATLLAAAPSAPLIADASASWVPAEMQAPIQVTLACAIALGCGLLLSPTRWYWAVITAFIVFNNARSRADTTMRALQRASGTIAGFFAGTLVATVVQGELVVSIAGILVLFFVGFYFLQVSYGLMIFMITIALALLYGVMGMFTPELLLLRLEETVVGGLAGAGVAFLVFPSRTSVTVAGTLGKYLAALAELIAAASKRAHGEKPARGLLTLSRAVDRAYADLAASARPLGGPWNAVTRFGQVREKLLLLAGCTHWSRALARSLPPGSKLAAAEIDRFDAAATQVQAEIAAVKTIRDVFFERQRVIRTAAVPSGNSSLGDDPASALATIGALLARLGVGVGGASADPGGRLNRTIP